MTPPNRSHGKQRVTPTAKPRELMRDAPDYAHVWQARIITLFPELFPGVLGASLTGRALQEGRWQLQAHDLREYGLTKHRNVDDTPAGGGAGMVLRADVVGPAIEAVQTHAKGRWPILYMSPRGKRFDQAMARDLAKCDGVTILCGRFEGVDERVIEHYDVTEVSLGDFVMTGGELAAQAMIDATVRLLPGVLGNAESTVEESHSAGLLEHPQYTKPAEWQGREIPPVLMSGNHGEIEKWRREMSHKLTRERRPDLWAQHESAKDD
ncbi:tRNA (guanosine(37)-N1)-methyltransferase TrmD [Sulfitobacter sp. F26169L]|uniref:tRNA (guanosine(37)-N1)-methyltransferase TrmD n=1 Tax=Sulfitobacter sp. F26169L TaxID=2996015 RepID=UPI002260B949|nr:tRNA (guanosine(37)-N1)-methyltransferase TrmD [Sulfitobacter sp. F26169L]MCX7566724.1 tRNA (guanosine(37)-N1)-methyltransferase TrmD [Sulfitobacter sp. F26169L]